MDRKCNYDFMIWLLVDEEDPDDFISLHPGTPRALEWCKTHPCSEVTQNLATNAEAYELWHYLEGLGFSVFGAS